MKDNLKIIGQFNKVFNDILSADFPSIPIYKSDGLKKHVEKRHPHCAPYLDKIEEILNSPDYIGTKDATSIELIKVYDNNILLALQIDKSSDYFYAASLYDISDAKLNNRLHSGRLKTVNFSIFEEKT